MMYKFSKPETGPAAGFRRFEILTEDSTPMPVRPEYRSTTN
jgi:hypothetical protein